jgi:hypothetical protein
MRAEIPASSRLFAMNREIFVCVRLRGGPGEDSKAELERGSGQARQYQQARRSLSAQPVRGRRTRRHSLCQDSRRQASALGHSGTYAATHEGRGHRACQHSL